MSKNPIQALKKLVPLVFGLMVGWGEAKRGASPL